MSRIKKRMILLVVLTLYVVACNGRDVKKGPRYEPPEKTESNVCLSMSGYTFTSGLTPDANGKPDGNGLGLKETQSSGSGFIIDKDGTIATNYHVVKRTLLGIAQFDDGSQFQIRHIKKYDPENDIAVLKIDGTKQFVPVMLGNSDALKQGEKVYAVGNLLGQGLTITDGIISQIVRNPDKNETGLIKHTASIAPGSSGGALYNDKDRVVGVNVATISQYQVHYAIPVNKLKSLIGEAAQLVPLTVAFERSVQNIAQKAVPIFAKSLEISPAELDPQVFPIITEFYAGKDYLISLSAEAGSDLNLVIINLQSKDIIGYGAVSGSAENVLLSTDSSQPAAITVINSQKKIVRFQIQLYEIIW